MGAKRHLLLAVAGVVLAAGGATAIVFGATGQTPPQPPPSAVPETPLLEVPLVEPDPEPPTPVENSTVPEEVDDPVSLPPSEPDAIDIPAIGVHSEMQQVGLTAEHTLEVPAPGPYYDHAAWYKHSVTPGAIGPSVIVGHVDSASGGPSVFFDLGKLRPGDEVLVTRRDGTVAIFEVDGVGQYSKDDFPTELVYGDTDHAALRLITCGGAFDRSERSYVDNIVVFASLANSHHASQPDDHPAAAAVVDGT